MTEFAKVGTQQIGFLALGTILMIVVPIVTAIIWTKRKKERFSTVLVGAATFLLFVVILEKPVQAVLIAPSQMGLAGTGISTFVNYSPPTHVEVGASDRSPLSCCATPVTR